MSYFNQSKMVLDVLRRGAEMDVKEVVAITGLTNKQVSRALSNLVHRGLLTRNKTPGELSKYILNNDIKEANKAFQWAQEPTHQFVGDVYLASSTNTHVGVSNEPPALPLMPILAAVDMQTGLNRITMVKRLRDRLIEEHHYALNVVIKDYEDAVRRLEAQDD